MDDCPGVDKCHGCLAWCDNCGDVDEMCEGPICWQHRCCRCNEMFTFQEREYAYLSNKGGYPAFCFACEIRNAMEAAKYEPRRLGNRRVSLPLFPEEPNDEG